MSDDSDDDIGCDNGDFIESTDDWIESESQIVTCLFCTYVFKSTTDTFLHCRDKHGFDIVDYRRRHCLDCFLYIKLINYIRSTHCEVSSLSSIVRCDSVPWADDTYMMPVLSDDPLLCFDIEELPKELLNQTSAAAVPMSCDQAETSVTLSATEYNELQLRLKVAETQTTHAQEAFENALTDISMLKSSVKEVLSTENDVEMKASGEEAIQNLRLEDDQLYVESYSHFSIHEEMLKDTVRTNSYRDCIYKNEALFRDRVVLDVGCGVGILSLFVARAGARQVIGVDQSEIIYQAMDIVRENDYSDRITLIHGKMEDIELPVEKVDIIISEWMGYFLLYESMLDTVLWARNQYLKADGLVLPDACSLSLVGIHDDEMLESRVSFWDDVSGFKMSCMKSVVVAEPEICVVDKNKIITEPAVVKTLNMLTCLYKDLEFTSDFTLIATRPGHVTALVGYFDVEFCCPTKVQFSTSPMNDPTHWKQTVFLLDKPLDVSKDESLTGRLVCKKNRKDPRCLTITITLNGHKSTYQMQ